MNCNLVTIVVGFVMGVVFGVMTPVILVVVKSTIIPFEDWMGYHSGRNGRGQGLGLGC